MHPTLLKAWRRGRRRFSGRSRPRTQLVYGAGYQVDLPGVAYDFQRGERILAFLDGAGLIDREDVHAAEPIPYRYLRRVHDDEYLLSLTRPNALLPIVGFHLPEALAERVLESQRTMVGGTLAATRLALASRQTAVSLGGGLHHAFAAKGERFCVYNDIATAIADLRAHGNQSRVLVVDLDLHDGDGTRSIFAADRTVHTFSIHNYTSDDVRAEEATAIALGSGVGDDVYLDAVRTSLPPVVERFAPEIVFYLAGCDPAADDQIGDWRISAGAMLERDRFVLSSVRLGARKLPLVIVLAGGYGLNAWRYSARFLSTLFNRGRPVEPPSTEELLLTRYRSLAREIQEHELTGEPQRDDWGLSAEDLAGALGGPQIPRRLLGFYSLQGLELTMERAGLLERVRNLGFLQPTLELDLDNPTGDTARLYGDRRRRELLIETRLKIDRRTLPGFAMLRIEWLLLQNPRGHFTPERPQLPGQTHPGLGMLQDLIALFVLACDRLQLDGLLFMPSHYHIAVHGRKTMRFLNPADEGLYRALEAPLQGLSLAAAAEAVAAGRVQDTATGQPFVWQPAPMVFPVSERLREQVTGEEYERVAGEVAGKHTFALR
ncbi:MAG TPA: histone deacetylase [Thermoanaerobaculia bacterium]|nr:histone deacetylase [Thermoanaerobaculia bacterium]